MSWSNEDDLLEPYTPATVDKIQSVVGVNLNLWLNKLLEAKRKLADLKKKRAETLGELSFYRARFSGGLTSHFEHERKQYINEFIEQRRAELILLADQTKDKKIKIVEGALDAWAYANPEYKAFLIKSLEDKRAMNKLEARLAQEEAFIEEAEGEAEYVRSVVRTNEEMLRFTRAEMGL